ncbi:MAG: hypothetical protein WCV67_14805 [Victivallaceae bacterium]|jgi:hypothetical protein
MKELVLKVNNQTGIVTIGKFRFNTGRCRDFYTGLLLLVSIPCIMVFQNRLTDGVDSTLPDIPAVRDYCQRQKLARLAEACQYNVPDAMLILSQYYQRHNEAAAGYNWLYFAAEKTKSPVAMWQLSEWFSNAGDQQSAKLWYSKAVQLDRRLSSKEFQLQLRTMIDRQEQRLYEK